MACDIVGTKEVLESSLKRAEALKGAARKTKEGELLDNTIEVTNRALTLLGERDFDGLQKLAKDELASDIATVTFKEKSGGEISAAVGKVPRKNSKHEMYVVKSVKHSVHETHGDMLEISVTKGIDGTQETYSFKSGFSRSTPSVSGGKVMLAPDMGALTQVTIDAVNGVNTVESKAITAKKFNATVAKADAVLDLDGDMGDMLGSAESLGDSAFKYERASEVVGYTHGSVDDMRNVLTDLHAIGGRPTTDKMFDHYNSLLGSMHQGFFKDMNLYINKNEDDAAGWVDLDKKHIMLNATSNTDSGMSNAEVYMHEIIHTMTSWALRSKSNVSNDLKARLDFLRAKAFKAITWKDLMAADDKLSVKGAKERFNYIFTSKNSDDEFVAFALTNPSFMSLLEKVKIKDERKGGLLNAMKQFLSDMFNAVMGNYKFAARNSDVMTEMTTLAAALGEVNNKSDDVLNNSSGLLVQAEEVVAKYEGIIEQWIGQITSKLDTDSKAEMPANMNHAQRVMFFARFFRKAIYNSDYRHAAGKFFTNYKLGATSSVREIFRSVLPGVHDHLTTEPEFLGLQRSHIDLARNNRVSNAGHSILAGFKKTLIEEEEIAITRIILESNGQTLFTNDKNLGKGYSSAVIGRLLSDTGYRDKTIALLKRRIQKNNKERSNWIIGQAEGLGIFMSTGKGHKALNSNSSNIVHGFLSNTRHKANPALLSLVEELASLTAISHENRTNQHVVANLLKDEEGGIRNVVNLYGAFIKESKTLLFKGDASHITEGYIKELFDDKIETIYAVMSKKDEMISQGFKWVSTFEAEDNSSAESIGYFVSDSITRVERLSGAVGLGNPNSRGMTLKEARYTQFHDSEKHAQVWFEADKVRHDADAVLINKQLEDGVPAAKIIPGPVPVLDAAGNAVDYRNMMPKADKARFLKQELKVSDVLAKTIGSVVYKDAQAVHNEKVTEFISKQITEVYDNPSSKDNELEITLVGPDNSNPEIRKLYYQLPKSLQRLAAGRADKSLPIPDMLMHMYFGYSHLRATDAPGLNRLPNIIKRVINQFEQVFMDLVKIAKGNILLKMPAVLVVNITSNLLFAVSTGTNPLTLAKEYMRSIKSVRSFMAKHTEVEALSVDLLSLTQSYNTRKFETSEELADYNDEVKRLNDTINRLNKEMEGNSVKELFDLGMYQAVIEDVSMYKMGETNVVVDKLDSITNRFPAVIKTPLNWLYLSKDTAWYKANQSILQMSDLVARDVMNRKQKILEQKQVDGTMALPYEYRKALGRLDKSDRVRVLSGEERKLFLEAAEKTRHASLLKYFINYNLPNGRGEEYLNRIGVLMFTKYVKRIQRVISETGVKHPINTIATLMAAGFATDLEMIQDSSFFIKAGDDYGLMGITPLHSPTEVLMTVVNPPIINLAQSLLGS